MLVKATTSFAGKISMRRNEVRECADSDTLKDLLNCGYVVKVKPEKAVSPNENKRNSSSDNKG